MVEPAFPGENVVGVNSNGFLALAIGMVLKQSYNNIILQNILQNLILK